jgi:FtsP/CotA-like multicopper oxidase with cupredoxin domain
MDALGGGGGNLTAVPAGSFDGCIPTSGSMEVVKIEKSSCDKEKWVAFDVIGTFGFITAMFSIDEHPMWVYAMDGEYVTPQKVESIPVTNGDRYSILVKFEKPGDFKIRVAAISAPQILSGYAILSLREKLSNQTASGDSKPYINDVGVNVTSEVAYFAQGVATPFTKPFMKQISDATFKLEMRIVGASFRWALNNTLLLPNQFENEVPVLFRPDPYAMNNVTITTKNDTWVDLILVTAIFPMPPHPIHKHGNKMFMIGAGNGPFNYSSVAEAMKEIPQNFNLVDPPIRDSFATPPAFAGPAWMAVRYHVSNPGAWMLHCHIQNHMMGGMAMIIQDGVNAWPTVPEEYLNF